MSEKEAMKEYLIPTEFINSEDEKVIAFVNNVIGSERDKKKSIIKLFYEIRDGISYDFNSISIKKDLFIASNVIGAKGTFCVPKAVLLTAAARVIGVPSRLGFADVKNHLSTEKVLERLRTDLFVFHGFTELFIDGKWVKATPAFNKKLCEKFNVKPLDFDGENDSFFQRFNESGDKYMDYVVDHGTFADLPYDLMIEAFKKAYPHLFAELDGSFF